MPSGPSVAIAAFSTPRFEKQSLHIFLEIRTEYKSSYEFNQPVIQLIKKGADNLPSIKYHIGLCR